MFGRGGGGQVLRGPKATLRENLKRHGLSMRKAAMKLALECLETATTVLGMSEEDACDKLLEIIEDEGVTSCVVDEQSIALAVEKFHSSLGTNANASAVPKGWENERAEGMLDDASGLLSQENEVNMSQGHLAEQTKAARHKHQQGIEKGQTKKGFVVTDAFDRKRSNQPVSWDEVHGKFVRRSRTSCLMPPASSKMAMFRERFFLLRRRVQRNKLFLKPALEHSTNKDFVELTEVSALLGCVGEAKFILCMISTVDHEDGRVYVEDLSGSVQVDLRRCHFADKGFFTENMIVLVEGAMQSSGIFQASAICFPPLDSLESDRTADNNVGAFFNNRSNSLLSVKGDEMFVLMSGVYLDEPECLEKLTKVFGGFEGAGYPPPALFVLMGPFLSRGAAATVTDVHKAYTKGFKDLASVIKKHATIHKHSCFLLVPGSGDPSPLGTSLLPQPRLQPYFTQALEEELGEKHCLFGSNPCRIHHAGQEIVIFRDDLQNKMRRHDLSHVFQGTTHTQDGTTGRVVEEEQTTAMDIDSVSIGEVTRGDDAPMKTDDTMILEKEKRARLSFERTCSTVLHQSHLVPLPTFSHPIMWDYDQAMWLQQVRERERERERERTVQGRKCGRKRSF